MSITIHKCFTLNGNAFTSKKGLLDESKNINSSIFSFLNHWFDDNDFVIVRTSGSTGKPKEIRLKKQHMINSAVATGMYFNLPERTSALLCLSADYIAGKMMLVRAMTLGWHLDVVGTDSNPLDGVEQEYDFSAMVPLQVYNSLDKLSKIKKLIIGGGVVSKELATKLQDVTTECFATYGMTETITHIAVIKLNGFDNVTLNTVERSHYGVLPNIKISKDNRNCLVIDAPKVSDELVMTNDLVEILSETEFKWLGRYDSIINSGGIKLIPEQIESKLSAVLDCRFFVAGIPDKVLGEKLILVIERDVTSSEERNLIKSSITDLASLSKYETPKKIYFTPEFVETETKKIQRRKTLDLMF